MKDLTGLLEGIRKIREDGVVEDAVGNIIETKTIADIKKEIKSIESIIDFLNKSSAKHNKTDPARAAFRKAITDNNDRIAALEMEILRLAALEESKSKRV